MKRILAGLALSIVAAAAARAQESGIEIGKKAPAASLQTLDAKPANLSDYIGKQPVLMEFWATWCPNCKELEPTMKAMFDKYGKKVSFIGVGVSVNQSPALAKRYVENHKLPWIQLYDTQGDGTDKYDVPATSYVVLIDKSGTVVYTGVGGKQNLDSALKKVVP